MKTIPEERTVPLQAMVPESLQRRVRVLAASKGCPPRDVVVVALEQYLPEAEKEAEATLKGDRQKN